MGITMTSVDNKTTFSYTNAQQLNDISMKYNISVDALKKQADRNNDALQGTSADLTVGDVLILSAETAKTIHDLEKTNTNQQPAAANTEEKEEPVFTEEKVTGAAFGVAAGLVACKVAAAAGAKIGGTVGAALGPLGAGVGIVAGAIIGGIVGWWIGDACN